MSRFSRARSAAIAAAGFSITMSAFAPLAMAQTNNGEMAPVGDAADLNNQVVSLIKKGADAKASLTIHKYEGDPSGRDNGESKKVDLPAYDASFTIQKVKGLDVHNVKDWQKYTELDPKKVDKSTLEEAKTVTTKNGVVKVDNLDLGFYYITEVTKGAEAGRTTIAPFFAALPMTHQAEGTNNTSWNYDVQVHPKNQVVTIKKTVKDQDKHIGNNIEYTINGDVPAAPIDKNEVLNKYTLVDNFDPAEQTPDLSTLKVSIGKTALTKDTDYKVVDNLAKGEFQIQLTQGGMIKLTDARSGKPDTKVTATFTSSLKKLTDGVEKNKVTLIPPNGTAARPDYEKNPNTPPPGTDVPPENPPSSEVDSKHGAIKITKVDGNDAKNKLEGAVFELYKCKPGTTDLVSKDKISVDGKSSWTTAKDGTFTIKGVQLEDWYNGASKEDVFDYCVIETKSPEGYELNPTPISVPVNQKTPKAAEKYSLASAEVQNFPDNGGFRLPETGAAGVGFLVLGGGALAAAGVLTNKRRKDDKSAEASLIG